MKNFVKGIVSKKIVAIALAAVTVTSAGAAMTAISAGAEETAACMSQYAYRENHNSVDCMHRYKENGSAVFVIKTEKKVHSEAHVDVLMKSGDEVKTSQIKLEANGGCCTDEGIFEYYESSDEKFDYFKVIVDYNDYYGNSYDAVGVKVYFSQYADRQMATDTAIGSFTEGNGYWLSK